VLFRDLGFHSLLAKLPQTEAGSPAAAAAAEEKSARTAGRVETKYRTINSPEALAELSKSLQSALSVAISTEGSSLSPLSARIVGISISPAKVRPIISR